MFKVKPFLFILFLTAFTTIFATACSDTSSSAVGGGYMITLQTQVEVILKTQITLVTAM